VRVTGRSAVIWAAVVLVLALIAWGVVSRSAVQAPARPVAGSSHEAVPPSPSDSASHGAASPSASGNPGTAAQGWKLKFDARFTGSRLNTNIWGTCYPWDDAPSGCTNFGNQHRQKQWNLATQDRVANGALQLIAQRGPTQGTDKQGDPKTYECRSGMVTTYPSFRFKYGYVQVVSRIPYGYGLWPSLWLAAANLKWPPEIDIMEHWGDQRRVYQFYHPVGRPQFAGTGFAGNMSTGWHSYGLLWSPSKLVWFVDRHQVLTVAQDVPGIPMYLIASLAEYKPVLGNQGCDQSMLIRSVQVWQQH
jgi:beta-glucanase (GH16 family)